MSRRQGVIPLQQLNLESEHSTAIPQQLEGSIFEEDNTLDPGVPLPDEGKDAWIFLACCVAVEAIIWGFSYSYGIFQAVYESGPFKGSTNIATIGTTASGIIYLTAPLAFGTFLGWPQLQRIGTVIGLLLMCGSLAASSFAEQVSQLIATQGVLYGIGCTLVYTPTILNLDQWFVRRKGLAYGFVAAGTGIGGVVLPFCLGKALNEFSFRTVLRAYSVILLVLLAPVLRFIRPRLPAGRGRSFDISFLKSPTFVILQLGNIIQSLGYFLPSIFLPTYASKLGASNTLATLSVVFLNIASVVGCAIMGGLTDKLNIATCIAISTVGSTLSIFLVWGLSTKIGVLYLFSLMYGLFAGSFSSTWPGVMRIVTTKIPPAEPTMVFAFLAAGRGIGNVVSGPVSDSLVSHGQKWVGEVGLGYGSGYGPLIVFTGISALLGGIAVSGRAWHGLLN